MGEPPPQEQAAEPEPWLVPVQIETARMAAAYHEYRDLASPIGLSPALEHEDEVAPTISLGQSGKQTIALDQSGKHSLTKTGKHTLGTQQGTQQMAMPREPSPFNIPSPAQFDLIGRVREYNQHRHGQRRLREMRNKKRLQVIVDTMK